MIKKSLELVFTCKRLPDSLPTEKRSLEERVKRLEQIFLLQHDMNESFMTCLEAIGGLLTFISRIRMLQILGLVVLLQIFISLFVLEIWSLLK